MITKQTCQLIWSCHNEIEKSKTLLKEMAERTKANENKKDVFEFTDAFGNKEGLKLAIPYSSSGHSLFNISPTLALKVIEEHITNNEKRLEELKTIAKIELNG